MLYLSLVINLLLSIASSSWGYTFSARARRGVVHLGSGAGDLCAHVAGASGGDGWGSGQPASVFERQSDPDIIVNGSWPASHRARQGRGAAWHGAWHAGRVDGGERERRPWRASKIR